MADGDNGPKTSNGPTMWPSAVVASVILILIGAITVTAIREYDTVEDALKIWAALSALIGVVTGAFVAYFFTKDQVIQANERADEQSNKARVAEMTAGVLWGAAETNKQKELLTDPTVYRLFGPTA